MARVDYVSGRDTVKGTLTFCESPYEALESLAHDFYRSVIDLSSDAD